MARLQAPRATTEPAVFIIITAVRQFLARALGDQLGVSPSSSLRGHKGSSWLAQTSPPGWEGRVGVRMGSPSSNVPLRRQRSLSPHGGLGAIKDLTPSQLMEMSRKGDSPNSNLFPASSFRENPRKLYLAESPAPRRMIARHNASIHSGRAAAEPCPTRHLTASPGCCSESGLAASLRQPLWMPGDP